MLRAVVCVVDFSVCVFLSNPSIWPTHSTHTHHRLFSRVPAKTQEEKEKEAAARKAKPDKAALKKKELTEEQKKKLEALKRQASK